MRITRIVALAIIAGTLTSQSIEAQTLRAAGPPAEFPPASFKGSQYVDSRGCIYIRAGIDGNVTWIPRVSRSRKQLCGYQPSTVAASDGAKPRTGPAPELITLPETPAATGAAASAKAASSTKPTASSVAKTAPVAAASKRSMAAPAVVTTQKPRRTPVPPVQEAVRPAPSTPKPGVRSVPAAPPAAARHAAPPTEGCEGASPYSREYINQGPNVRCGPQAEPPVTYGRGGGRHDRNSSVLLTPNTRLLPTHVYQERRLSTDLQVPEGYKAVWEDDRLNLHRGERTAAPAVLTDPATVPDGYIRAERDDGRLNPLRGGRSAEGDAQMAQVWTNTVPRKLVRAPVDRPRVHLTQQDARSAAELRDPLVLRLSTRSAPSATDAASPEQKRRYVRAATFADPAAARLAAEALVQRTGLPVRLGRLTRKGTDYKVVLVGPFTDPGAGEKALQMVRDAGHSGARLSK